MVTHVGQLLWPPSGRHKIEKPLDCLSGQFCTRWISSLLYLGSISLAFHIAHPLYWKKKIIQLLPAVTERVKKLPTDKTDTPFILVICVQTAWKPSREGDFLCFEQYGISENLASLLPECLWWPLYRCDPLTEKPLTSTKLLLGRLRDELQSLSLSVTSW